MGLLCCYIGGVYVRPHENICGIRSLGGFNHWYCPGFWSQQQAASSLLLHLNECTDRRAEGTAFRVGGLYWSPDLLAAQDLTPDIARAKSALRDFTRAPQAAVENLDDGSVSSLRCPLLWEEIDDACFGHNRAPLPHGQVSAAPLGRAPAAPPVPVPVPVIPVVTEHKTPVDGAAASAADVHSFASPKGNNKKRTTEQEEHIDTPLPKKNGSADGKWRAEGFVAPSQLQTRM
jgi:hypothetical protein